MGRGREPINRIYPITEAGIFNKHIEDLGIFDVGNLTYTNDQKLQQTLHTLIEEEIPLHLLVLFLCLVLLLQVMEKLMEFLPLEAQE